jgi:hypothetical protein
LQRAASNALGALSPGLSPNFGGEVTRASAAARHPTNCAAVGAIDMLPPRSRGNVAESPPSRFVSALSAGGSTRPTKSPEHAPTCCASVSGPCRATTGCLAGGGRRSGAPHGGWRACIEWEKGRDRGPVGGLRGVCGEAMRPPKKIAMNSTMAAFGGGPDRFTSVGADKRRHPPGRTERDPGGEARLTWRAMAIGRTDGPASETVVRTRGKRHYVNTPVPRPHP